LFPGTLPGTNNLTRKLRPWLLTEQVKYWFRQEVLGLNQEDLGLDQEYLGLDQEDFSLDQEDFGLDTTGSAGLCKHAPIKLLKQNEML
jgi:hypothetical protein